MRLGPMFGPVFLGILSLMIWWIALRAIGVL